jgi:cyclophilin family peptidyl-prolyl cis-trans isomerase/HEAT repeat protein
MVCAFVAPAFAQTLQQRMLAAEDARVTAGAEMAPLVTGLRATDPRVVVQAVRAFGRFERPELVTQILPLVTHARPEVRAEALNALGQALARIPRGADEKAEKAPLPPEAAIVRKTLLARIDAESDPYARGVAAETLGRLPYRAAADIAEAEQVIARVEQRAALAGAVKGLETLIRVYQKLQAPSKETLARLRTAATLAADPSDGDLAYVRRVAWLALNAAAAADARFIERGLEDPDPQVRRLAVLALANAADAEAERPTLITRALRDPSFIVRYDAVRVYSRTLQDKDCDPVLAAVNDSNAHVALAAIDALGNGCPGAARALIPLVDSLPNPEPGTRNPEPGTTGSWHRAAHAFVSLARVAREEAASRLSRFAEHPTWQVRMYAARAAETLAAAARLERLARDPHDNVREAAVQGLVKVRRHEADAIYIEQLTRPDYQLVMAAAKALDGSPNGDRAIPALVAAFARITAEKRDTSRDARLALLERIRDLGGAAQAAALEGPTPVADTPKVPLAPVPTVTGNRMRITMQRGGHFDLRLFPDEAPATIARVVRLARQGYYNGLTFHRVVPNFVLQGGSPGANEYMGDGPFMRDELGLRTHARGTLGISTRGRDTGDAQLFINLLDNVRLDHNFTVFAEVTSGLDIVDGILEGDVIDRVDVLESATAQSRP